VIVPVENTDRDEDSEESSDSEEALPTNYDSDAISTDVSSKNKDSDSLATECERLKKELEETQAKLKAAEFRIDALSHDEKQLHYYTGFKSYKLFKACFDFLGPAACNLNYWDSS